MEWGIVWSVIVAMVIFLLAIGMIAATFIWLMVRKFKKGAQTGATQKFSFPCAAFFGEKTETATK